MGNEDVYPALLLQGPCCQLQQNLDPLRRWAHTWQGLLILELAARYFVNGELQEEWAGSLGIDYESAGASESPVRYDLG